MATGSNDPVYTDEDLVRFWNGPEYQHICENLALAWGAEGREAEDIAQEVMLELLKAIRAGRPVENPAAYANTTASHLRLRVRGAVRPFNVPNGTDAEIAAMGASPRQCA